MSCPYNKEQQINHCLNIKPDNGKCPARGCPVLKNYVEKQVQKGYKNKCEYDPCNCNDISKHKCPFLKNHKCSYLNNLKNK